MYVFQNTKLTFSIPDISMFLNNFILFFTEPLFLNWFFFSDKGEHRKSFLELRK